MERYERLKILRILSGLTQEGLSQLSGLPRGSISIWERGDHAPGHEAVPTLSKFLGCHPGYLMYGSPRLDGSFWEPSVPSARHTPMFTKELDKLFPSFCAENGFNACASFTFTDDSMAFFLGSKDKGLNSVLLVDYKITGPFLKVMKGLECVKIDAPKNYRLEEKNVKDLTEDDLSLIAHYSSLKIDIIAICRARFASKELRGSEVSNPNALKAAFLAFCPTLQEYDVPRPDLWHVIEELFEMTYQSIRRLPTKNFTVDADLKEKVSKQLEKIGCKKRIK